MKLVPRKSVGKVRGQECAAIDGLGMCTRTASRAGWSFSLSITLAVPLCHLDSYRHKHDSYHGQPITSYSSSCSKTLRRRSNILAGLREATRFTRTSTEKPLGLLLAAYYRPCVSCCMLGLADLFPAVAQRRNAPCTRAQPQRPPLVRRARSRRTTFPPRPIRARFLTTTRTRPQGWPIP